MPDPVISTRTPVLLMSTNVHYIYTVVSLVLAAMSFSITSRIAVSSLGLITGISSTFLLSIFYCLSFSVILSELGVGG